MIKDNNKDRQGRSKEQVESSYIGCFVGIIGLLITILIGIIMSLKNEWNRKEDQKERDAKMKEQQADIDKLKEQEKRLERLEAIISKMDK